MVCRARSGARRRIEDRDAVRRGHHDPGRGGARDAAALQVSDERVEEVADGHAEHERQQDGADQPQRDHEHRQESEPEAFGVRRHGNSLQTVAVAATTATRMKLHACRSQRGGAAGNEHGVGAAVQGFVGRFMVRRQTSVQHGVRMWRIGGHRAAVASCAVHMCALSLHQLRGLGEATFVGRWVTDAALTNQHAGCRRARAFQHGVRMWRIGGHRTAVRQLGRTHTHALITPVAGRAVAVDGAGQRDGWGNQCCESGADERPRQPG